MEIGERAMGNPVFKTFSYADSIETRILSKQLDLLKLP